MEQAIEIKAAKEIIPRNTDKKRIEALEDKVDLLEARINKLTKAIVESAHIMGWPKDLLEKQGIRAFDKDVDKLSIR